MRVAGASNSIAGAAQGALVSLGHVTRQKFYEKRE